MGSSARGRIYKVSLLITPEAEETAVASLEHAFQQPVSVEMDVQQGTTQASVYLERKPSVASVKQVRSLWPNADIRVQSLRREDWAESWKRHFKPISIGGKLLVLPSWSRRRPRKGQAVVVLDPGLSFGTGQHPTTHFCLEEVTARAGGSMLDLGTGSGILAIAAARLGYERVEAIDFDSAALRIAKENAKRNRVQRRIVFACQDVTRMPLRSSTRYDLVCANLICDVLISARRRIVSRLAPGGELVLAGILAAQFEEVETAFRQEGLKLARAKTINEWRSGAFDFS